MKKLTRIALIALLLLVNVVTVSAEETASAFDPYVEVSLGVNSSTVVVSEVSNDVLAERKPTLSVPVNYNVCYITLGNNYVDCTIEDGIVTFTVEASGTYRIVNGTKPVPQEDEPSTPVEEKTQKEVVVKAEVVNEETKEEVKVDIPVEIKNETAGDEPVAITDIDQEVLTAILTEEEIKAIEEGASVSITAKVEDIAESIPEEEKEAIENELGDGDAVALYLDINLFLQVGDNPERQITDANGNVEIEIEVPTQYINQDENVDREYYLVRIHDGKTERIDGTFDPETGKFTFKTKLFSTYALAYADKPKQVVDVISEEKKSSNSYIIYLGAGLVLLAGAIVILKKTKKEA